MNVTEALALTQALASGGRCSTRKSSNLKLLSASKAAEHTAGCCKEWLCYSALCIHIRMFRNAEQINAHANT